MKAVKLTFALALLGAATLANASYWSRTNYGANSTYPGSRMGGWNLSGNTWNDYVFKGETQACQIGSKSCSQTYTKAVNFNWTWGVSVTATATIVPDILSASVTGSYSENRGYTDTNTYSVTIDPGKKSQYAQYVPRRYGDVTVYGVRSWTGGKRAVCTIHFLWCHQWADEWEYNDDPRKKAAVLKGWKNISDLPIHTFIVTKL